MTADPAALFEAQRPRLVRLAYRMLGSLAEAEDVAQDAWLRWQGTDVAKVREPAAWLAQTVTRLCLDRLKSAKARHETYVGPWLPEPLVEPWGEDPAERAEDVSVAFLLALQRLTPLERAVFLLHDVFDQDYADVAKTLGRTEAACRQLAARARGHVKDARPRFTVADDEASRLAQLFMQAARNNDWTALGELLTEDAVMITDGGGKRSAALRPLIGRDDVLLLLKGLASRGGGMPKAEAIEPARINGCPGAVVRWPDGPGTIAVAPSEDGRIAAIYIVRNPEKLSRLGVQP